jgi:hypothetical protein
MTGARPGTLDGSPASQAGGFAVWLWRAAAALEGCGLVLDGRLRSLAERVAAGS